MADKDSDFLKDVVDEKFVKNFGKLKVKKGELVDPEIQLHIWLDFCTNCSGVDCKAHQLGRCKKQQSGQPCIHEVEFIKGLTATIFKSFAPILTEPTLNYIGMTIIPQARILVRAMIEESCLTEMTAMDDRGRLQMHPIYSLINTYSNSISRMWKDVGFMNPVGQGLLPNRDGIKRSFRSGYGDPDYYELLGADEEKPEKE